MIAKMSKPSDPERLLTAQQVAKHLQISDRTFEHLVSTGNVPPFIRLGRLRRWHPVDLSEWIRKQAATTRG